MVSTEYRELATDLLKKARAAGADAADLLVAEGTEFSVTVRRGEVETLKEAGSKGLGIRVFVGQRTASSYTSDFSRTALQRLVEETVAMARVTGEDPAAGLPDEMVPPVNVPVLQFHGRIHSMAELCAEYPAVPHERPVIYNS